MIAHGFCIAPKFELPEADFVGVGVSVVCLLYGIYAWFFIGDYVRGEYGVAPDDVMHTSSTKM